MSSFFERFKPQFYPLELPMSNHIIHVNIANLRSVTRNPEVMGETIITWHERDDQGHYKMDRYLLDEVNHTLLISKIHGCADKVAQWAADAIKAGTKAEDVKLNHNFLIFLELNEPDVSRG